MSSPNGAAHVGATPTPERPRCHLQRGANGRWALTTASGGYIEADAAAFVEIEQ